MTGPFLLSNFFCFYFFWLLFSVFFLVPCGRLSWLPVSFSVHENMVSRVVSYRISYLRRCEIIKWKHTWRTWLLTSVKRVYKLRNNNIIFWPRHSVLREEKLCYANQNVKLVWSLLLLHKTAIEWKALKALNQNRDSLKQKAGHYVIVRLGESLRPRFFRNVQPHAYYYSARR